MITKEEAAMDAMEFLKRHTIGVLATANLEGIPFASPVYYAAEPDFSIYFATSHHTQKFKNLLLNKQVALCVGTGPQYIVVNIHGVAEMKEGKEMKEGLKRMSAIAGSGMAMWPIKAVKVLGEGGTAIFKIKPQQISYLNLATKDQLGNITDYFYEILP